MGDFGYTYIPLCALISLEPNVRLNASRFHFFPVQGRGLSYVQFTILLSNNCNCVFTLHFQCAPYAK